ncbi:MAG: right-handed parallel beta-helix repeat-containing protein [Candidatus Thorarchaeota archaeon]
MARKRNIRISDLSISTEYTCINISNVDAFFTISNCSLFFNGDWYLGYGDWRSNGVALHNTSNGIIESCRISNKSTGIFLNNSANYRINSNTFERCFNSLNIEGSSSSSVSNNTFDGYNIGDTNGVHLFLSEGFNFSNNIYRNFTGYWWYGGDGIYLRNSTRLIFANSHFVGINTGIYAYFSSYILIENCTFVDMSLAGEFSQCSNIELRNCVLLGYWDGIRFYTSFDCLISNCMIAGDSDSPIVFWDSSECTIENSILNGQGIEIGFYELSRFDFRIDNVTLNGKLVGYFEEISSIQVNCTQYNQIVLARCSEVELHGWGNSNLTGGISIWSSEGIGIHDMILRQLTMNSSNSSSISDVTISDDEGGIQVSSCSVLDFENTTIRKTSGYGGFDIDDSENITVINSHIQSDRGISIYGSIDCQLSNIQIETEWNSLEISGSSSCILLNSGLTSIWDDAIRLSWSGNLQIEDCVIGNGGFSIYGNNPSSWFHTISNVTIDNKPLGYFTNTVNLSIDGNSYSQLIFVECSNITVQNVELTQAAHGIQFAFSTNCRISDVILSYNTGWGYHIVGCDSIIVERMTYFDNSDSFRIFHSSNTIIRNSNFESEGIEILEGSLNTLVTDNTFRYGGVGVRISSSSHCTVSNNRMNEVWRGIDVHNGEGTIIFNNSIVYSNDGIDLWSSTRCLVSQNTIYTVDRGIEVGYGGRNMITSNRIRECDGNGISIYDETLLVITYNEIVATGGAAIEVWSGSSNLFYGNLIYYNAENNPEQHPVIDNGDENQWDDGEGIGNCWGEYRGAGPIEIPGSAGSQDNYPIFLDSTDIIPPIISSPPDIVLQGDENKSVILWIVWGPLGTFALYQNGYQIESGLWNGSGPFFHELNFLGIGNHTFTLEIYDPDGIMDSDSVIVQSPISLTLIVQISAVGAGTIVVFCLVFLEILKRRRISVLTKGDIPSQTISFFNFS